MLSMKERGALGGKQTALKYNVKLNNEIKYNLNPHFCQECSASLPYEKRKYKFCSRQCSTKMINRNKKKPKLCIICESVIIGKGKFFCSKNCYSEHRRFTKSRKV